MEVGRSKKWTSAGGVVLPNDLSRQCYVIRPANNFAPWSFPKGQVDAGETLAQAAVREVLEETGVRARILPNAYLGAYEGDYSITHYFLMKQVGGRPRLNDEVDKILLLPFAQAYDLFMSAGNRRDTRVISRVMEEWEQR